MVVSEDARVADRLWADVDLAANSRAANFRSSSMRLRPRVRRALLATLAMVALCVAQRTAWGQEVEDEPAAGYDSGFFVRSADSAFLLRAALVLHVRYAAAPIGADEESLATAFSLRRARIKLRGHAVVPELGYAFQVALEGGFAELKDFYLDYAFWPSLHLGMGQAKRPFSRMQLVSGTDFQLVERTITEAAFGAGRDIGVWLHNGYLSSPPAEWAVGVYNGTGIDARFEGGADLSDAVGGPAPVSGRFTNLPDHLAPTLVARVGYNHGGIAGYVEGDRDGGPFGLAIGLSALAELDGDGDDRSGLRGELDMALAWHGLFFTSALFAATEQDGEDFADQAYDRLGYYLQAGYAIDDGRFEPAVRWAQVEPEDDAVAGEVELAVGLSLNLFDEVVRWVTDGALVGADLASSTGRVRSQFQLQF
jgi:hypothetical protein